MTHRWHLKVNKAERIKLRRTIKSCTDKHILKPTEPISTPAAQAVAEVVTVVTVVGAIPTTAAQCRRG